MGGQCGKATLTNPGSGASPSRADETWAIYYNFDQYLWNPANDPTRAVGIFGRAGPCHESTSAIAQFYSFGFGGRGLGSSRPHDRWGLRWYYVKTSGDLPDSVHLGDEQGGEVFYNFAVTPACMITADLQVTDYAKGRHRHRAHS